MRTKFLLSFCCLSLLVSCSHKFSSTEKAEIKAEEEMKETYEGIMGCTEEEVVLRLGAPKEIQYIGELKIYKYRKIYEEVAKPQFMGGFEFKSVYDYAEILFKDGRAFSWKGEVKR